jgi:hypothetical protein
MAESILSAPKVPGTSRAEHLISEYVRSQPMALLLWHCNWACDFQFVRRGDIIKVALYLRGAR